MKCKHGSNPMYCCKCRYGHTGHRHESKDLDNPKDLVDELKNKTIRQKLKDGHHDL